MTVSSVPNPVTRWWMTCSAATLPVTSTAWMLASIQCAGLVSAAPVDVSVIVATHRSRPSNEWPYDSTVINDGCAAAVSCSQAVSSS